MRHKKTIALSIPTGVGASIGGYAGDAGKIAKMFSRHFNVLCHPNVVNGGILSGMNPNILYTEGYIFDEFFKGNLCLEPLEEFEENTIGVIFDKGIPQNILNVHINTINAAREVMGINILDYEITKEEVGVEFFVKNGVSSGSVKCEKTLLDAAKKLISKGCSALAVVCYFGKDADSISYEEGIGVDPIGGVEAVISHYLSKELLIPIAHAPAFYDIDISEKISNPKVASENISSTYLPCILIGLSKAPKIVKNSPSSLKNTDIEALIIPHKAFGGVAPLAAYEKGIKILAVENKIIGGVSCTDLGGGDIIKYRTYEDCLCALV